MQLCPLPVKELSNRSRNKVIQNTIALGVITYLLGLDFEVLETALKLQFGRKGEAVGDGECHRGARRLRLRRCELPGIAASLFPPAGNPWRCGPETTRWRWGAPLPGSGSTPPTP